MSKDVFLNIDHQPIESISIIADRLEIRSQSGQFANFRNKYFEQMKLNNNATILELGGGTGVIGRSYINFHNNFCGCYVVSDLSKNLINKGKSIAKKENIHNLMDFIIIDAMKSDQIKKSFYDAVILHTLVSHVPNPQIVIRNSVAATKKGGLIVIFDADYASLQISSGDQDLDHELNTAIKVGCVAQPFVMRQIPFIVKNLNLDLIHCNSDLLFEVQESEFFVSMAKALSSMVVKAGNLKKDIAEEWLKKIETSITDKTFFGMCPFISYIFKVK
tara:strand:- start:477 stop:1301 length:825 start_codon:yes stop_codon:yes gene_type:complete